MKHGLNTLTQRQKLSLSDGNDSPPLKKARVQPSVGKTMLIVYCNQRGEVTVDFVSKGTTITGVYYASLLKKLRKSVKIERHGMLARVVLTPVG